MTTAEQVPAWAWPHPATCLAAVVLALGLLAFTTTPTAARAAGVGAAVADAARTCTVNDAELSDAIDRVSDWPSLHAYQQAYFPPCPDEGAAAQAHAELVARTLAERWAETGELAAILRASPAFRDFFFRHLNAQGGKGHLQAILSFATIRCPRQEARLCAEIRQTVGRALEKLQ